MKQFTKLRLGLVAKHRVAVGAKGLVNLGPVLRLQYLARQRQHMLFFGLDVAFKAIRVLLDGACQISARQTSLRRSGQFGAQLRQVLRALGMVGFQGIQHVGRFSAAKAQQAEQVIVLLGVVHAVDKLGDVVQRGVKKGMLKRCTGLHVRGHLVQGGSQAPHIAVLLADDGECVHGVGSCQA